MTTAQIEVPPKLEEMFSYAPGELRYRCAHGGRGSGKTRTFALMTAVFGYILAEEGKRGVILCGREYMNSLEESSMEEVKEAIRSVPWLDQYYDIGEKYIRTKNRKIKYVFCGLRHNLDSIKSKAKILIAWVDEAEMVSDIAWKKLIPTVRESGSEIWVTWNPEKDGSATDTRFRKGKLPRACIAEVNHDDNPWFPDELEEERLSDYENLPYEVYAWIWLGAYLVNSEATIFAGYWQEEDFTPADDWDGPYDGLDFGFANDPTAATRAWIYGDRLWIEYDFSKVRLELDDTSDEIKKVIPNYGRYPIIADNARPESISYLKRHGFPRIEACEKGKGSVEDGIEFMKSFRKIIVHPRCRDTKKEFLLYSYKVDRLTGKVLPDIVDANNHLIDSIRYSTEPIMKSKNGGLFSVVMAKKRKERAQAARQ